MVVEVASAPRSAAATICRLLEPDDPSPTRPLPPEQLNGLEGGGKDDDEDDEDDDDDEGSGDTSPPPLTAAPGVEEPAERPPRSESLQTMMLQSPVRRGLLFGRWSLRWFAALVFCGCSTEIKTVTARSVRRRLARLR